MRIKVFVETGFAGQGHEDFVDIPDDEWSAMTEDEQEERLEEEAREFMGNCIDYGAYIVEETTNE